MIKGNGKHYDARKRPVKSKEAAEMLDISLTELRRMRAAREIGFFKKGHYVRIPIEEIERFKREGFVAPADQKRKGSLCRNSRS